jgi:phenylacetate-CoA ligase
MVVITPLFNTAQPLIRYEQGDIAIRGVNCACGKTLPVLQEISGRITNLFHLPGGRKISPILDDHHFTANFGAKTWQLVQTGPLAVDLRYVQTDPGAVVNTAYAEDAIRKRIHQDIQITFVRLATTPLTPGGKFIQYKSELQDHSMAIGRESNG